MSSVTPKFPCQRNLPPPISIADHNLHLKKFQKFQKLKQFQKSNQPTQIIIISFPKQKNSKPKNHLFF